MDVGGEIRQRLVQTPDAPAMEIKGVWRSWGDVAVFVSRLDGMLGAAGLSTSCPVGLIARNRFTHLSTVLALFAGGHTVFFIHSLLSPEGLAAEIEALKLPAILADRQDWASPLVVEAARKSGSLGISLSESEEALSLVRGLERCVLGSHRATTPDTALELLTSGTTGLPKRVPVSWHILNTAMGDAKKVIAQNFHSDKPNAVPPIRIHHAPLGNLSGVWTLLTSVLDGSPLIVFEKFEVASWVETVRRHRPHYVGLVPTALKMVLDADVPAEVLSSVTVVNTGGAKLDPDVQKRFEEKYDLVVLGAYGATEFFGGVASWTLADRRNFGDTKFGSTGRARPGAKLRIVGPETGAPLPPGQVGLVEVQLERAGPQWTRTTDLGVLDEDGFLFIKGRADGAISRGGFKIHPQQIADVICRHPSVADASVVGVPDDRLGQVPVAAVELIPAAPPPTPGELEEFARKYLIAYQVPVHFLIVEKLPRTLSLKISEPDVRALFKAPLVA